jgi:hypothetical protein
MVARLRGLGSRLGSAATSVREAGHLEELGADFIVAQDGEGGGHRGTFLGPWQQAMTGILPQCARWSGSSACQSSRGGFSGHGSRDSFMLPDGGKVGEPGRRADARLVQPGGVSYDSVLVISAAGREDPALRSHPASPSLA